jgi:hypothetical protein
MNHNLRIFAAVAATSVIGAFGLAISPNSAHAAEDDPGWNCATQGNRVCGSTNPRVKILVSRLARRPALTLPGQWVSPAGPALVNECFASYPGHAGRASAELLSCLAQPDPRISDPRVITVSQAHRLHQLHLAHSAR